MQLLLGHIIEASGYRYPKLYPEPDARQVDHKKPKTTCDVLTIKISWPGNY